MKLTSNNGRLSCIGCLIVLPFLFMLVLLAGCPQGGGSGNNNDNDNGSPGSGRAQIVTPSSSFGLSLLDPPFQVRYNVPDDATGISGYRFAVANSSLNSPAIGDKVTIATNLQAGSNKFFDFDPSEAGVGYHRVGISFTLDGDADLAESSGVIQVEGPPDPIFIQPAQQLTVVEEGDVVSVSFDVRDPEGEVQWRLFYLDSDDTVSAPADRIGTQLAIGEGNVGNVSFRTEGLPEGDYTLGISATDSGMSVAATVAAGDLDRIVTVPAVGIDFITPKIRVVAKGSIIVPTITITNPGNADIELFKDETFTIRFTAVLPPGGPAGTVEVFYDTDTNVNNGFTIIADDLSDSDTQVQFPTGVPEGTYFIGATIRDGISAPVTDYSTGRVIVTRSITLAVTEPNTTLAVAPNTPVTIRWTTNAPDDAGTVDVFAQRLGSNSTPTGPVIPIITGGAMSLRTATFTSATSGLFQITVRLNITGETAVSENSPRPVRISTLPAIAWLGSIAETTPRLDGAIFGGVNFEDNAGSAFAKADDYDGDGLNEFVIAARYGKPFFEDPGVGEAYLIYGARGAARLQGVYNLNSVGEPNLRGITFTGIRTEGNSTITEGLSDVLSVPDADGDEMDELVFGFPKVYSRNNSYGPGNDLSLSGQFMGGGVVIVSSTNGILAEPEELSPVLNLDLVGQDFSSTAITPNDVDLALDDRQQFEEAEDPVEPGECVEGTDGVVDTVIGPAVGFVDFQIIGIEPCDPRSNPTCRIGLSRSQAFGLHFDGSGPPLRFFEPIGPDVVPMEETCPTATDVIMNRCEVAGVFGDLNAGSGFYPLASQPQEPFGARIVGRETNDHFGTSLAFNLSSTGAELIISAPERDGTSDEVQGLPDVSDSGVAYITRNRNFWGPDALVPNPPPTPHQYIINFRSHCSSGAADPGVRAEPIIFNPNSAPTGFNDPDAGALKVVGDTNDKIENLLGLDDFNGDGRNDLVIGAPNAAGGNGRVYIAYRRLAGSVGLEGDFVLNKLLLPLNDTQRLDGLLISTTTMDGLGASLAGNIDFNGDGNSDLVIGSPDANGGTGEVIVVFGRTGITSSQDGISVSALLSQTRTDTGGPVAVRLTGATVGGEKGRFGFNVANAGDVDGDGKDDLLIAAPEASPRFDPTPNDAVDELSSFGIDLDLDGVRDQVPGDDELRQAGVVYVIYGSNRFDELRKCAGTTKQCTTASDCSAGVACTVGDATINIDQLGSARLQGLMFAGRRAGDRLGGGDASDPELGGIDDKDSGRGEGLGAAGDVDGDGRDDILLGALTADSRRNPNTGEGVQNGGEAYLIYGSNVP